MDVSIIIVSYNTKGLLSDCLQSIKKNTKAIKYEIIVSDNGSTDGTVEMINNDFQEIVLIQNYENIGFGAANNRALAFARGKYIFYLNSDTILLNNAVKEFYDFWERYEKVLNIGCLGSMLLNKDLQPTHSWGHFPTPFRTLITLTHLVLFPKVNFSKKVDADQIGSLGKKVDGYITGAALFLKNDVNAIFDERYFMYAEETDLEYNHFYRNNKSCILIPNIKIIHLEGGSDKTEKDIPYDFGKLSVIYYWISIMKYMRKNYPQSIWTIQAIKMILIHIWKKEKNKDKTCTFLDELKLI